MQELVYNQHRYLREIRQDRVNTSPVVAYYKKVTDPEQFVPLFTCIPFARPYGPLDVAILENWFPINLFPSVHNFVAKQTYLVQRAIFKGLYTLIKESGANLVYTGFKSYKMHTPSSVLPEAIILPIVRKGWDKIVAAIESAAMMELVGRTITMHIADSNGSIPTTMYAGNGRARVKDWVYGLALTDYEASSGFSNGFTMSTPNFESLLDTVDLYAPPEIKLSERSVSRFVLRYMYMGLIPNPTADTNNMFGYLENCRSSPDQPLFTSRAGCLNQGVVSLFCVMVKAKHRPRLMASSLVLPETDLTLPKGDLCLWEDEKLQTYLAPRDYRTYVKALRSKIRNHLKASVYTHTNLTDSLFTIEKPDFKTIDEAFTTRPKEILKRTGEVIRLLSGDIDFSKESTYAPNIVRTHL